MSKSPRISVKPVPKPMAKSQKDERREFFRLVAAIANPSNVISNEEKVNKTNANRGDVEQNTY